MFLDGTASYPMNCYLRLTLTGRLDRLRFQRALERSLTFHPLLQAKVVETRKNRYAWKLAGLPVPVDWQENVDRNALLHGKPYNLFVEPPLRMTVREYADGGSELILELHHSASDASGILLFLEHFFTAYHRDAAINELEQFDVPKALENRFRFAKTWRELLRGIPSQLFGLPRAWYFLVNRPEAIVPYQPPQGRPSPPEGYPFLLERQLTSHQTAWLRDQCKRTGTTINDRLLTAAYLAIFAWRKSEHIVETGCYFRVAVPTDLRNGPTELATAANRVSMVFLDRKSRSAEPPPKLLTGIHREMAHIKRHRLGWAFIFGLSCFKNIFGGFRGMIRQKRCWSSCVLSNPGRVFHKTDLPRHDGRICLDGAVDDGTLVLEKISASPPIRPWTVFGINAVTYCDEMFLTLHYDPVAVTAEGAKRFLTIFLDTFMNPRNEI